MKREPDRLVPFTDAVVAIAITLLVLPLVEHGLAADDRDPAVPDRTRRPAGSGPLHAVLLHRHDHRQQRAADRDHPARARQPGAGRGSTRALAAGGAASPDPDRGAAARPRAVAVDQLLGPAAVAGEPGGP